jgi:acetyl esterase/lipase
MTKPSKSELIPLSPIDDDRFSYRVIRHFLYKRTLQGELGIDIHFPFDWRSGQRRPAIVFFFGGAWVSGTVHQFHRQATYLASRGMVAARADYRVKDRHGVRPRFCVQDAKSAVRWLRQNATSLGIDPKSVIASGGSAGGHLALATATVPGLDEETEDRSVSSVPNACVLFNPVVKTHDWPRVTDRRPDMIEGERISPIRYLCSETPPMLIFFGTDDDLGEPISAFMARAAKVGCHAEVDWAEGQKHGFFNDTPWMEKTLYRTDRFLTNLGYLTGNPSFECP